MKSSNGTILAEGRYETSLTRTLIIAGWTGRDAAAVEKHIRELEELGIMRPKTAPIFYRVSASLLTTANVVQVLDAHSSGEVEYVLHSLDGELWVGLGSDHTDRKAEVINVSLLKQMCAKPVSQVIWRYEDVVGHWDQLVLRSYAYEGGQKRLYQEGPVSAMKPPAELIKLYCGGDHLLEGCSMFCGTLAVHGGIKRADEFEMELVDPVLQRMIGHRYRINELPNVG